MIYERDGVSYPSYGSYLRDKGVQVDTGKDGRTAWDKEITDYKDARRQGVNPAGTKQHQIDAAMQLSDHAGKAFDAADGSFK